MAADTREDSSQQDSSTQSLQPLPIQDKPYERSCPTPENANALPGGAINTAGGKIRDTKLVDAVKTIKLQDFKEVHKKPCARDALLAGIGVGFGMGGIRAILGGLSLVCPPISDLCLTDAAPTLKACSWAVGAFCFGSFFMHEFCQRRRQLEMKGLKRAVEVIDRKKSEKQAMVDQARMARLKPKAEDVRGR